MVVLRWSRVMRMSKEYDRSDDERVACTDGVQGVYLLYEIPSGQASRHYLRLTSECLFRRLPES